MKDHPRGAARRRSCPDSSWPRPLWCSFCSTRAPNERDDRKPRRRASSTCASRTRATARTRSARAGRRGCPRSRPPRADARSVTYYFVGAPANVTCANCKQIPLDLAGLRARVEKHLGVTDMEIKSVKNKICDLKPMWPVLFPEVSARHEWVGFADADVLFGDLAAEVDLLTASDDLLVPSSWHPYPLANGNFMLFRSTARVLQAFRGAGWREAVRSPGYSVFDEWPGPAWKPSRAPHESARRDRIGSMAWRLEGLRNNAQDKLTQARRGSATDFGTRCSRCT